MIDDIRREANKALHPNPEDPSKTDDFSESAKRCINKFCEIIALYRISIQGRTDNKFKMVPDTKLDIMELSYQVMFENNPDDRYRLARVLDEQIYIRGHHNSNYNFQRVMYLQLLEICSERDGTVMAVRDFTHLKLYGDSFLGVEPEKNAELILDKLRGLVDLYKDSFELKALFGRAVLIDGLWGEPDRWQKNMALQCLEEAAEADIPVALTSLSELYRQGSHTDTDIEKSIKLLEKAVELGDPIALKLMGDIQLSKGSKDLAIASYRGAIDSGMLDAAVDLARTLASMKLPEEAVDAYQLYRSIPNLDTSDFGSAEIGMGEQMIICASNNFSKMIEGLLHIVNAVHMHKLTAEDKAIANKVAGGVLKRLKGKVTEDMSQEYGHLFLSFYPDGKIKKFENIFPGGRPPESNELFDFSVKRNPANKKEQLQSRNELCSCGTGKKYKRCCGK